MNTQNALQHVSRPILTLPVRRPRINSLNHQQIAFILDRSGSMADGTKAQDASAACQDAIGELAQPVNKDAFEVAVIEFDETAHLIRDFTRASAFAGKDSYLHPDELVGGTNITAGLRLTKQLLDRASASPASQGIRFLRPFAVVMTDGGHNTGPDPLGAANDLRSICDILTVAFGYDADEHLLRKIASDQLSVRCANGAELRRYFAEVGRTLTVTRAAGQSPLQVLASGQQ